MTEDERNELSALWSARLTEPKRERLEEKVWSILTQYVLEDTSDDQLMKARDEIVALILKQSSE